MRRSVIENFFINLVGNQKEITTEGQLSKAFKRSTVVGRSRWIARAIEDNRLGSCGDELLQFVGIDGIPVLFTGGQEHRRGIIEQGLVGIRNPKGNGNDDFIARFKESFGKVIERMFRAA